MTLKTIKLEPNKAGRRYALCDNRDGTFSVYAECHNYASHCRGGYAVTWRYCEKGLLRGAADVLFARKIAGKVRL